ncbi:MAG: thioredoxin family protein [Muribaculaceae bacterium]|nr:thioredoxin family protein [Muribaculaceae bacterium]
MNLKKSLFLLAVLVITGIFYACGGNAHKEAIPDEEMVEMTPNEVVEIPSYEIKDNHILPVDGKPMIVDFSATWCPPCKALKPIFEKLAEDFRGRITFVTIDVDEQPELAQAYGVSNIPALIFLNKDGQVQNTIVGFQNRDQLLAAINTYFGF